MTDRVIEKTWRFSAAMLGFKKPTEYTIVLFSWLWEAFAGVAILSLYRLEDKRGILDFFSQSDGKVFIAATIFFACTTVLLHGQYRALGKRGIRPIELLLRCNILPFVLIIIAAEILLRIYSVSTPEGVVLAGRVLGPRQLERTVHSPKHINEMLIHDSSLGWTVKPNFSSPNNLYVTREDGTRSSKQVIPVSTSTCRVALVGDSHTFGQELKLKETWGYYLERRLLKQCEVRNFGVPGYSVGQMYLRYLRDVRPWHPHVVIFALASHSSARTMGLYGLNSLPDVPWAQPRFQLKDHEPIVINLPLPTLEDIAAARWMSDLPFIDNDWYYVPGRWEQPRWRYMYHSYLFRVYLTWFPLWRTKHEGDSEEAINHALLHSFVQTAKGEGSIPLVFYLPDTTDYELHRITEEMPSHRVLRTSGIKYYDLRPCLDKVETNYRFLANGTHYAVNGSMAIARCVAPKLPQSMVSNEPLSLPVVR